ncbi:MAG: N-acetyl-gamma-glutamyl-phosphate reductase [Planctomycetota bacterium]|nr:N-acetyl-gamma-glutamyl-phosphate reductase [Planctomycetota bacterium]
MIQVGILGATGYTALELIKILLRHPKVEIIAATSRQEAGRAISSVHPSLSGRLDLSIEENDPQVIASKADCIFCCLPHGASAEQAVEYLNRGKKVVDFSADYRLHDLATYESWYQVAHPDAERVGRVAYGLPELFEDQIVDAQLVANPGCFPTSAILALAPLLKIGRISEDSLIVDSKTGVSGGGRKPKLPFHYPECNENVNAYNVGQHRHMPEIDEILSRFSGAEVKSIFTPHLIPMDRGILSTIYAEPVGTLEEDEVMSILKEFYQNAPFVHVVDHLPATKHVSGTNHCHITARMVRGRLVLVSCIDNLIKGASGAAVQNMNCMYGWDQTMALLD